MIVNTHMRVVAGGSVNPPAHFCASGICIITNNAVHIKHLTKNP